MRTLTIVLDAQEATACTKRTNSSEGSFKAWELSSQVIQTFFIRPRAM
jgi:hypothetical protein